MLVMWHKQAFQYESHVVGIGFIVILGLHTKSNLRCAVVNVYATCNMSDKESLWEGLTTLINANLNWAWCLCGEFNAMRCASKGKVHVKGVVRRKRSVASITLLKTTIWWSCR